MGVSENTKVFRSFLLSKSIIPPFLLLLLPRRCCSPPTPAGASSSTPLVRALVAFTNKHTNKPRPSRLFIPFHFNNNSPFLTRRRTLAAAFTNIQTNRMRPSRSPPPLTPTTNPHPSPGAYFGLVASYLLTPPDMSAQGLDRDNTASYSSDMLAMVGTLFLFLYWPSFSKWDQSKSVLRACVRACLVACLLACVLAGKCGLNQSFYPRSIHPIRPKHQTNRRRPPRRDGQPAGARARQHGAGARRSVNTVLLAISTP